MVNALQGVTADPAYASLSPDIRTKPDELLAKLDEANGPTCKAGAEAPQGEES